MIQDHLELISSSGNVFEDLGFKDARQRLAKAEVASCINDIIDERGLTQNKAGADLGTFTLMIKSLGKAV